MPVHALDEKCLGIPVGMTCNVTGLLKRRLAADLLNGRRREVSVSLSVLHDVYSIVNQKKAKSVDSQRPAFSPVQLHVLFLWE